MTKRYIRFKIWLDSPYKWGPGYGEASDREVALNESALKDIAKKAGFEKDYLDDGDAVYINRDDEIEELYMHPMEISGTIAYDKYDEFVNFVKNGNYEVTKYCSDKKISEEKIYNFKEIVDFAATVDYKMIKHMIPQYAKWGVPGNYNFKEFGFLFKEYTFAHNRVNSKIKEQKEFLVSLFNEIIEENRKGKK